MAQQVTVNNSHIKELDKIIGKRIRYLRQISGLTQAELALKLNISPQQLQKYEKGSNKISASRLEALAEILNAPVNEFFVDASKNDLGEEIDSKSLELDKAVVRLVSAYRSISSRKLRRLLLISADTYAKQVYQ